MYVILLYARTLLMLLNELYYLFQMSLPVVAPGEQVIEMMIPASKVGLIIGKFRKAQPLFLHVHQN